MALVICSECGSKVSDLASSCPRCGRPRRGAGRVLATIVVAGFVILGVAAGYTRCSRSTDEDEAIRERLHQEQCEAASQRREPAPLGCQPRVSR